MTPRLKTNLLRIKAKMILIEPTSEQQQQQQQQSSTNPQMSQSPAKRCIPHSQL
jgi:hypothetical protein